MPDPETNSPLLNPPPAMDQHRQKQAKPTALTSTAITSLAALKVILGASCVIAPQFACSLFLLKLPPQGAIAGRLFGSSCAALGLLTWKLNKRALEGNLSNSDLKTALALNIMADTADTISCLVGYSAGMYGLPTLGMLGGGCVALAVLGAAGYAGIDSRA